jgi:hypothetical protein
VGTTYEQLEASLPVGTKVKVETIDGRTIQGQLRGLSRSGLVFDTTAGPTVPIEAIRSVSQPSGRRPVVPGLLIGLGSGAAAGVIFWASQQHRRATCRGFCDLEVLGEGLYVVGMIGGGAAVGAVVGVSLPRQMQVVYRAPTPPRVAVAPLIAPKRLGIAFSVVF